MKRVVGRELLSTILKEATPPDLRVVGRTLTHAANRRRRGGGSVGDFAPAPVIGGLFGGAFGRAAQLLLHDPRIDPGAFALVAMVVLGRRPARRGRHLPLLPERRRPSPAPVTEHGSGRS